MNSALDKGYGTAWIQRGGRDYELDMIRIESDGMVIGAVVLAFDITESLHAEQRRREFSANVSHELKTPLQSIIGSAEPQEQVVDALVREVKSRHVRRLRDGLCSVEYGFVLEDLLTAYERTADHCSNVAVEMLQVAAGKLEAHEYLNALKAGELHESAAFAERFAKYKAQYMFPEETL